MTSFCEYNPPTQTVPTEALVQGQAVSGTASMCPSQVESTMPTVAESCFLPGDTRLIFLIRTSKTRWAENFNLNVWKAWEQHALPAPAHWRHQFPPAAFQRLLPFLWLTRVSTTACSFRKRCSSHSTSWSFSSNHWNTQAQSFSGGYSNRYREQSFLSSLF